MTDDRTDDDHASEGQQRRISERAQLNPDELKVGSGDARRQAEAILVDSDLRASTDRTTSGVEHRTSQETVDQASP